MPCQLRCPHQPWHGVHVVKEDTPPTHAVILLKEDLEITGEVDLCLERKAIDETIDMRRGSQGEATYMQYECTVYTTHFAHDDGAINSQLQVIQSCPHCLNHTLHSVYLLPQENVHWCQCTHFLQHGLHLGMTRKGTIIHYQDSIKVEQLTLRTFTPVSY